ncbi:MAG: Asp-tRNA(Asn)/Glu-tRNA(Gln) amidotransferase GatCAB subunit B [Candidatus Pacebacteria bacterium CG10_big_fil_rev_8_21_14_0_10_44_11]|nr:MAG: Asp-tRNA(Asn)/Glu-tRNA(Gln) amidotransferase GatCAB subunit B [Candidatus Pacebacteria bacterium CG10_big_fil_rev_8_21_14_0_10_44_11]
MTPNYKLICGMEIHAELKTQSKMFCGCKNDPFHAPTSNSYTCPTCLGMPGALPVANKQAIEWTVKLGLALGCKINLFSKFDRKHYFYPDLPKGYQISQYDLPFCYDGQIETSEGLVRIRRIHLEEDTGKLLHKTVDGKKVSLIDFNRSSVPLIEIVTEPDITSAAQATEYSKKLRQILQYLDIANCDMEQGGMRLEANVSLQKPDQTELPNYKIELKNINSFRFLEQAVEYEISRQTTALDAGEDLHQETRGWNSTKNQSFVQRSKETAEDYRYFPDPDLPPIRFSEEQIEAIRVELPELQETIIKRWQDKYRLEPRFGHQLAKSHKLAEITDQLFSVAFTGGTDINKLASAIDNKKIVYDLESDVDKVITDFTTLHATETVNTADLDTIIQTVIKTNPDILTKFKQGQQQVMGFFMGQIMHQLKVKADPQQVHDALNKALENC